jgi:hypothetical protein
MKIIFNLKKLFTLIFSITLTISGGCSMEKPADSIEGFPPRIETPLAKTRILLKVRPKILPEGAKAHFPAYDGDRFFVTLPVREQKNVSSKQALQKTVLPILQALGFERGKEALSLPPSKGIKPKVADFKKLAQDVAFEYQNNKELYRPKTQKILDAFLGKSDPEWEIDRVLEIGEGMNFNQFVAGIERQEIQFPFQQVEGDVPIEHTLVLASRWQGQNITTVRGVVFNQYIIANQIKLSSPNDATKAAIKSLSAVNGVNQVISKAPEDGPHLVLLPYGSDPTGRTILRYAYRMLLRTVIQKEDSPFFLWLDAETGKILKLNPLFNNVQAAGKAYRRDPGAGEFENIFEIDPAIGGQYILKTEGLINRLDYKGDGDPANDLSISDNSNGSSSSLANFDQAPINDSTEALCGTGSNKGFQQVNFLSSLNFYTKHMINLGMYTPFPKFGGISTDIPDPWDPQIEVAGYCNAHSSMKFGACEAYYNPACPNFSIGGNNNPNYMNFAHDKTVIAHEIGHTIQPRLTYARPSDWCGPGTCSVPVGWIGFHDLADAWAAHFESTNCTGGWVGKNQGGVDASLNCANHYESSFPRLHEVSVPFNPSQPGDHFPEKPIYVISVGVYANGQIPAAALWETRLGMRSKCRSSGVIQYVVRLVRALKNAGFIGSVNTLNHSGIYKQLYDLELEMVDQWAISGSPGGPPAFKHNGPSTTNKVTAGFAKTGLFLIPYQCLDGDPTTGDPGFCSVSAGGENGGDAVIDIDDNDIGDDLMISGVAHPEVDFLELGGDAPTFNVWTGPRYKLDGPNGDGTFNSPASCNSKFRVEVSTDETFSGGITTINSPWIDVDTDPTTPGSPECYGTWTPTALEWDNLQTDGELSFLYYRARTRDSSDGNERISTEPGNGLWSVSPSYAVLTTDGQSEY